MFHEHQRLSNNQLKQRLKEKLENDEYCAIQLRKLYDKGASFDMLWNDKLYSSVSKYRILNKLI